MQTQEEYQKEMEDKIKEISAVIIKSTESKTRDAALYKLGELTAIVKWNHPLSSGSCKFNHTLHRDKDAQCPACGKVLNSDF